MTQAKPPTIVEKRGVSSAAMHQLVTIMYLWVNGWGSLHCTIVFGACLAPSATSFSPSALPFSGQIRICCGAPTSAGGKLYLAINIPPATALAT